MADTYKIIELVGASEQSVADAIRSDIERAAETIQAMEWFETTEIRGRIKNGKVEEFQVGLKIGFKVLRPGELP